jgi:hypothetical protein
MKILFPLIGALALINCTAALAQEDELAGAAKPRYAVLPRTVVATPSAAAALTALPTWNGSFVYQGTTYNYTMVGTAPSTNTATRITAVIIPLKIVITKGTTTTTFDPATVLPNGKTVVANTVASPLFDATTTYIQGGTNLGTTQYIDAYQRGNFWGSLPANSAWHLTLGGPKVLAARTLSPPATKGKTGKPFGSLTVAEVDINWLDARLQSMITSMNLPANVLPIFLTTNTYLTSGGCCIGGYHSAFTNTNGTITYMHASYITQAGDFAQDVSALSHEIGEWADDPLINNNVACGVLENGDPEEGFTNYGGFPYTVNGFTYNLQDLVFLPYFGAPASTSVHGWLSFQGNPFSLTTCSNGG